MLTWLWIKKMVFQMNRWYKNQKDIKDTSAEGKASLNNYLSYAWRDSSILLIYYIDLSK
jgi:hypothetical protein